LNPTKRSWLEAIQLYARKQVIVMLFLGFSAGLPFLLLFSTLTAYLTDYDVSRSTIGFFAWVGMMYSIKVLWAPVVDSVPIPKLTALLGRRRSWLLVSQLGIVVFLILLITVDPKKDLGLLALCALCTAFCSATQDICIDAFRIESAEDSVQGAMASTYLLGYRFALIASGAGALFIADIYSWSAAYYAMAAIMGVCMLITLRLSEPAMSPRAFQGTLFSSAHFNSVFVEPIADFFRRNGRIAIAILLLVGCYRISDITMGIMANPFYLDLGFTKTEIASVSKTFGLIVSIIGAIVGGVFVARYGVERPMLFGAVCVAITNLLFAQLAQVGADIRWLVATITADNLCGGFAGSAFIAYLSSITNRSYSATQYALFSSFMTLPGKFISGFSGVVVDTHSYTVFFIYAALMGIPAIVLSIWLVRRS